MARIDPREMLKRAPDQWEELNELYEQMAARELEKASLVETKLKPGSGDGTSFLWRVTELGSDARASTST